MGRGKGSTIVERTLELRWAFLLSMDRVCPQAGSDLVQVALEKASYEHWLVQYGAKDTWLEQVAKCSIDAWKQKDFLVSWMENKQHLPLAFQFTPWKLPTDLCDSQADPYPIFIELRVPSMPPSVLVHNWDAVRGFLYKLLDQQLEGVKDTAVKSMGATIKLPNDLWRKLDCTALYHCAGLDRKKIAAWAKTTEMNIYNWVKQCSDLLDLRMRPIGRPPKKKRQAST
jgi:hypothetical protein